MMMKRRPRRISKHGGRKEDGMLSVALRMHVYRPFATSVFVMMETLSTHGPFQGCEHGCTRLL